MCVAFVVAFALTLFRLLISFVSVEPFATDGTAWPKPVADPLRPPHSWKRSGRTSSIE